MWVKGKMWVKDSITREYKVIDRVTVDFVELSKALVANGWEQTGPETFEHLNHVGRQLHRVIDLCGKDKMSNTIKDGGYVGVRMSFEQCVENYGLPGWFDPFKVKVRKSIEAAENA